MAPIRKVETFSCELLMFSIFMKITLLSLTLVLTYGCSSKKSQKSETYVQYQQEKEAEELKQKAVEQELVSVELVGDELDAANPSAETVELELSTTDTQQAPAVAEPSATPEVVAAAEESKQAEVSEDEVAATMSPENNETVETNAVTASETETTDTIGEYLVQKGDTLMIIAFKIYGDPSRWSELYVLNKHLLGSNHLIEPNTKIQYQYPNKAFSWKVSGTPYLILRGDTLQKISHKVYVTSKLWKSIWNNNLHIISDPNLIWAGFTLFTLPKEQAKLNNKAPMMPNKEPASL